MRRLLAVLTVLAALSRPAGAIMASQGEKDDVHRFGLDRPWRGAHHFHIGRSSATLTAYNASPTRPRLRAGAGGAPAPGSATPRQASDAFLLAKGAALGLDSSSLVFVTQSDGGSHKHVLYNETYKGLPVEFSTVKVHLDAAGAVTGVDSDFRGRLKINITPSITAAQAGAAAVSDAGGGTARNAQLVIWTDPSEVQAPRLAWRLSVRVKNALWRYYVDAQTGGLLLRFNDMREFGPCTVQGDVEAYVYTVDPVQTPLSAQPMQHERVFVGDGTHWADTYTDPVGGPGAFCSQQPGKIFTNLQGPYVSVNNFRGVSANYNNGSGVWEALPTAVSSPHPYPADSVLTSTIDLSGGVAPGAVEVMPVFSNLSVGVVSGGGGESPGESSDVTQDDQLQEVDQFGRVVGSYVGQFTAPFYGSAVPGTLLRLQLTSGPGDTGLGYDVQASSYLVLNQQYVNGTNNNLAWTSTATASGLYSEIGLFYHLNVMHDFFASLMAPASCGNGVTCSNGPEPAYVGLSTAAYLPSGAANAVALAGPGLVNAFYDPDYNDLFFGDVNGTYPSDAFAQDATVPHHEYTHYVVEKIWHFQNFGQAGAISEAGADYFSASSFEWPGWSGGPGVADPNIGQYVMEAIAGLDQPLREIDDAKGTDEVLGNSNTPWNGEIHLDSVFVSQAYWDIRKAQETAQGGYQGAQCTDRLILNALLYFPESFQELYTALLDVDASGVVALYCGGAGALQGTIENAFAAHGLILPGGTNDPYDVQVGLNWVQRNDGFDTATDVSSTPVVNATIYPAGDLDFFTFGAGPGTIHLHLNLPANTPTSASEYKGYELTLYNVEHQQVAQVMPSYNSLNTVEGLCGDDDCNTTQSSIDLYYDNPTGQQMFAEVNGGPTFDGGSNSGVSSSNQYQLTFDFPRTNALGGALVSAQFDNDVIGFDVQVTTWEQQQVYYFGYAQLRDQAQNVLENTQTSTLGSPAGYLTLVSSNNALGSITGSVQLQNGFTSRFPAVGDVYLEVFGYNVLGSTVSLGLSNPIYLTSDSSDAQAWNNVFDPLHGQKTTIKWDVQSAGELKIRLYTINGTFINTLLDQTVPAGSGAVDWLGTNDVGSIVASGIYLVRVDGPGVHKTLKAVVVK